MRACTGKSKQRHTDSEALERPAKLAKVIAPSNTSQTADSDIIDLPMKAAKVSVPSSDSNNNNNKTDLNNMFQNLVRRPMQKGDIIYMTGGSAVQFWRD